MKKADDSELDVEETELPEEEEATTDVFDITYYPADITLKGYFDKFEADTISVPDYQRHYVWNQVQASKLIESFLLGLPVPGVFLYQERKSKKLSIVDGQQRILSVVQFFKGTFGESKFRLKGVMEKWKGKSLDDLTQPEQLQLHDSVLRATIIQQLEPNDNTSVYHIFERLNTGGVNLTPMEIRKCVYHGKFFCTLENCNKDENWRKIIGKPTEDKRLRDIEFILRILALKGNWSSYEKPMKRFLNTFIASFKDKESHNYAKIEAEFKNICEFVVTECGEKPFHLRSRLNYAVMDSCFAAAYVSFNKNIGSFGSRLKKLFNNEEYVESATKDTSDEVVLKKRFNKSHEILCG